MARQVERARASAVGEVVTAALEQLLHRNVQRFRGGLVFKASLWQVERARASAVGEVVNTAFERSAAERDRE